MAEAQLMRRFLLLALVLAQSGRAWAQIPDAGLDDPAKPARWFATFSIIAFEAAADPIFTKMRELAEFKRLIGSIQPEPR
jgi:hypothetical protein